MWREYTRETPARRGLGVATAAMALIGTTALAWVVTQQSGGMRLETLPNWPITFSVPEGFNRLSDPLEESPQDGLSDRATFLLGHPRSPDAILEINYEILQEDVATLEELMADRGMTKSDEVSDIMLGTLAGKLFRKADARGRTATLVAVGRTPEGLVLGLWYTGSAHDPHGLTRLKRICESIQFRAWTVPRPPAVETSRRPRR